MRRRTRWPFQPAIGNDERCWIHWLHWASVANLQSTSNGVDVCISGYNPIYIYVLEIKKRVENQFYSKLSTSQTCVLDHLFTPTCHLNSQLWNRAPGNEKLPSSIRRSWAMFYGVPAPSQHTKCYYIRTYHIHTVYKPSYCSCCFQIYFQPCRLACRGRNKKPVTNSKTK